MYGPPRSQSAISTSAIVAIGTLLPLLLAPPAGAFELQAGWPVVIQSDIILSPLVVADLDDNGTQEVVVASCGYSVPNGGFVYVFASDASNFGPFPLDLGERVGYGALGDLDQDGQLDIVVPVALDGGGHELTALRHWDGTPLPGWPVPTDAGRPTIADVDGNGVLDVLVSTTDRVRVFTAGGSALVDLVTGYPCEGMQAVGDADSDEDLEILIGTAHGGVFLFDHNGNLLPGWPNDNDRFPAPVTMADVDGDGVMEMIAKDQSYTIFLWRLDGTLMFSQGVRADLYRELVPHDLDGDDDLELVFVADFGTNSAVDARHHDGTPVSGWPQAMIGFPSSGGSANGEPGVTVVDIDGDGASEILATSRLGDNFYIYAWETDGTGLADFPITIGPAHGVAPNGSGQIATADLDGDGDVELLWVAYQQSLSQQIWKAIIYAWDLPGSWNAAASAWPQFHQGPDHRGSLGLEDPAGVEAWDPAGDSRVPGGAHLGPSLCAFPNPFSAGAGRRLLFVPRVLPAENNPGPLTLDLLDAAGRFVRRLAAADGKTVRSGDALLVWDGRDARGRACGSGVYIYRWSFTGARGRAESEGRVILLR